MSEKMYDEHEIEEMEKQAHLYSKMADDLRAQAMKARLDYAKRDAQRESKLAASCLSQDETKGKGQ